MASAKQQKTATILNPHDHDVLSGRGNFVNYHAGNEHFRALVRKHKVAYVQCPKPQKGKFSKMIVDEVKSLNPPGRFLKQDMSTKMWYDIGEKKSMDKTRQALREGAPEIMKEGVIVGDEDDSSNEGVDHLGAVQQGSYQMGNPGMVNGFNGEPNHPYATAMGLNQNLSSPVMNMHNQMHVAPGMNQHISPQNLMGSPGMMMGNNSRMSPEMQQQLQLQMQQQMQQDNSQVNHMGLTPSQLQQRLEHSQMNQQMNQQMGLTPSQMQQRMEQSQMNQQVDQHQQMQRQMLNAGMGNSRMGMGNAGIGNGPVNPDNVGSQPNMQGYQDAQALQNRLASIYPVNQFEPRHLEPQEARQQYVEHNNLQMNKMDQTAQSQNYQEKVVPAGYNTNNPRRKPPPSLKRENSLKFEKIFNSDGTEVTNAEPKKKDGNGSSNHFSAMSLSLGDMLDDDNLSSVFDSSLRIGDKSPMRQSAKEKVQMKKKPDLSVASSSNWEGEGRDPFDMSVATIGEDFSERNNMSFATVGDNKALEESNVSFSQVFEKGFDS